MAEQFRGGGLYGRDREVAMLNEVLGLARSGRCAIALVDGEAGIGKTRLLRAAAEAARESGMQLVAGVAVELERTRPFGLVVAALGCVAEARDPRRAAIADLLAGRVDGGQEVLTVTSDPGLQFRVIDAIVDLVEELALAGPLALCVDDLQWADSSSLLTLGAIIRRVSDLPVALVGSSRPRPHDVELERFLAAAMLAEPRLITVGPLDEPAVRELAIEITETEPSAWLFSQLVRTAGNPLFITELVTALRQEEAEQAAAERAPGAHSSLPPTLRLTILRRLSFLPETTLSTLRAAAVLGSHFSATQLSTTTSRTALELAADLSPAIADGVLEGEGAQLRFRHDLIRDAIYQDLPFAVRCALHREAGQRLATAGAPVQQVAEQFFRGAEPGDAEAIGWLVRAGRESAPRTPEIAADLLGRAIALVAPGDPQRDELIVQRARNLMWGGRIAQAIETCEELLARSHASASEAPARLCLGRALLSAGHVQGALTELEMAVQEPSLTGLERASALGSMSVCHIWLADLDAATVTAQESSVVATTDGNHMVISAATTMIGVVARFRGELTRSLEICDEAVRLADHSPGKQGHRYPVHAPRGYVLVELDRLAEARSTLDTGLRLSNELGNPWHLANYQMVRAVERYVSGEWDDAVAEIEASIELAQETGEAYGLVIGRGLQAMIRLHRNDLPGAAEAAAEAMRLSAASDARYDTLRARRAHALVLDAQGRPAEAYAVLSEVWDCCTTLGHTLEYRALGADLVRLALAASDPQHASRVSCAVSTLAAQNSVASLTGTAMRCKGLIDDDPDLLVDASKMFAQKTRPLELALTCEDAGASFARLGQAVRARPLLEQAESVYRQLGATRDIQRTEEMLRAVGVRHGRRGPRKRPQLGWGSLTVTEHTVAALATEGLTNPQIGLRLFISPRTVQTHLAHIYGKLGLASRTQLAAEVTRRTARDPESRKI